MSPSASCLVGGAIAGLIAVGVAMVSAPRVEHFDYWDAHRCINHLDGSIYEGTADRRDQFPAADTCAEYVHHVQ